MLFFVTVILLLLCIVLKHSSFIAPNFFVLKNLRYETSKIKCCKTLVSYRLSKLEDTFERAKEFLGLMFSKELMVVEHHPFSVCKIDCRNVSRFAKICLVTYFWKLQNTYKYLSLKTNSKKQLILWNSFLNLFIENCQKHLGLILILPLMNLLFRCKQGASLYNAWRSNHI